MITMPLRVVEKVFSRRTSAKWKRCSSIFRVTWSSISGAVAPGYMAATMPVWMTILGSSRRGMVSSAYRPAMNNMPERTSVTWG